LASPQKEDDKCIMCEKTVEELNGLKFVRFVGTGYVLCCLCHDILCKKEYFNTEKVTLHSNKNKKEKIPHSLRVQVYERDMYRCVYCGSHKDLTLDHAYPESLGGIATLENLVTSCRTCNAKKGAKVR